VNHRLETTSIRGHRPEAGAPTRRLALLASLVLLGPMAACTGPVERPAADLILHGGRIYTLDWTDPAADGTPAPDAPHDGDWHPDASAVAVEGTTVMAVGDDAAILPYRGEHTRVIDLDGATLIPGLVDSHTHVANLGATLEQVDLVGVGGEEEAVERVARRAGEVPPGEWIVGYGWDDGAWADDYPDKELLGERVPDHPVLMRGLHGFAVWGNQAALDAAGITAATRAPEGGRIERGAGGEPTGLLLDRATALLTDAVPAPDSRQLRERYRLGLDAVARAGYTAVHEAGVGSEELRALEALAAEDRLPVRVYAMLSARDEALCRRWADWGPDADGNDRLLTRAVKAFHDGALGSRGARLLDDYSDRPGHRGVSGAEYGFDEALVREMMAAGFQVAIHAIGDAAVRDTLDFLARNRDARPGDPLRHRIEHAQVIHPADFRRFAELDVIASMQPPHAIEDRGWARQRLGPVRVLGAYAWRTLRLHGVSLALSSDLPGSDHDPFYGLHGAIARQDRKLEPPDGWYPEQRLTVEEVLRAYTDWAARAALLGDSAGRITPGRWADFTVVDTDVLRAGSRRPADLLESRVLMTVVGGEIFEGEASDAGDRSSTATTPPR